MNTKHAREGVVTIDHRASPGLGPRGTRLGEGSLFEVAVKKCNHCQRIIMLNPLRIRSQAYCPKCDEYVCDQCEIVRVASGHQCKPYDKVIEEIIETAERGKPIGTALPLLLTGATNG
jgi:hypothetical protein